VYKRQVEGRRVTFACTEIRMNSPCRVGKRGTGKPCSIAQAMYDADEAWRSHLRSLTVESMLAGAQLPKEQVDATKRWVEQRLK
jgi:DNA-binding IscR family transcriptional regulator